MMKTKLRVILLAIVLVLVLCGAYAGYHKLRDQIPMSNLFSQVQVSETFKDCTVYDLNGEPVALSTLLGKPVLLNFWATWCPYCVEEFPDLQRAYEAYGDKVNFVMVNYTDGVRETVETASAYVAENAFTFPVYYDKDSSALNAYGIYNFPTTALLSADGTLIAQRAGAMTYEMVAAQLEAILNQS